MGTVVHERERSGGGRNMVRYACDCGEGNALGLGHCDGCSRKGHEFERVTTVVRGLSAMADSVRTMEVEDSACIVCGWDRSCVYCVAEQVTGTDCLSRITDAHSLHLVAALIREGL